MGEGVSRRWDGRGNYVDERGVVQVRASCSLEGEERQACCLCAWSVGAGVAVRGAYNDEVRRERERLAARLAAGEVLVRVLAAGMNNTEINTRLGR